MSEQEYNDWHKRYTHEDDTQSVWHQFVKKNLDFKNLTGKVILEIGCGRGGLSNYIITSSPSIEKIYGCDYSKDAIEIAKRRFGDHDQRICWRQENIQDLTFPDETFDRVISCETIEHVRDPKTALEELFRVLKPGGKVFLTCPNYFNFFGIWCVYRWLIGKPYTEGQPYVNYITLPRLLVWLRQIGFRIETYHTSHFVIPLKAHYLFYEKKTPLFIRWLGFRSFFVLSK